MTFDFLAHLKVFLDLANGVKKLFGRAEHEKQSSGNKGAIFPTARVAFIPDETQSFWMSAGPGRNVNNIRVRWHVTNIGPAPLYFFRVAVLRPKLGELLGVPRATLLQGGNAVDDPISEGETWSLLLDITAKATRRCIFGRPLRMRFRIEDQYGNWHPTPSIIVRFVPVPKQ